MMRPLLMIGAVALAAAVPPAPRGPFECSSEWDQASATASATLSWPQVPGSIHLYDLEVGTSEDGARQFPFASVTSATPTATVGGLRPDTTYYFKVRAHCDGTGDDCPLGGLGQMIGGWSNFSSVVPCKTGQSITASPPSEPPTKATAALVETEWLEVYRVTENQQTWPDFLANHDTGDIKGDSAFLTFAGGGTHGKTHFFNFDTSPRVRYCVEVQKVSLQIKQRTPSAPPFIPVDPRFADYLSCNGNGDSPSGPLPPGAASPDLGWQNYSCICDNHIDRVIAHQTQAQLTAFCGNSSFDPGAKGPGVCNCSDSSLAASLKHVGFMPMVLPFNLHMPGPNKPGHGPPPPPSPPPPSPPMAYGGWYHFPAATKCPDDGVTPVGSNGCTWRRDPRAYMLYGKDLLAAGWNLTTGASNAQIFGNEAAMAAAMGKLTTRKCGEPI